MRANLIRAAISLCAGALLAAMLLLLLHGLRVATGWNVSEWLLSEFGKWPLLGSLARWAGDPKWHPLLLWLAGATTIWPFTRRAAFFAEGRADPLILRPLESAAIDMAPMPWVEAAVPSSGEGDSASKDRHGNRTWHDQRRAMDHLLQWARRGSGNSKWGRLWPRRPDTQRQPGWQPVAVALLTGVNGIGKSSLAAELGRRMQKGWPPEDSGNTGWRLAVARWRRAALPWLERLPEDPWHVGALQPADAQVLQQLKS